ncbi:MAG: hypothetical protein ABWY55_03895 [Microbacterium sp.]
MGRRATPLPAHLRGVPFAVASAGLPEQRTYAADLWTPARGTRLPVERVDLEARCLAHALTLPSGSVFSHTTAARIWRMPLPRSSDDVVHITVPSGERAPRRRGAMGHQARIRADEIRQVRGIRVTSPVRTFLDLADMLDLPQLVAVGDRIIGRRSPLATALDLHDGVSRAGSRRGIQTVRVALHLLDDGAESPKETELRLMLRDAGFGPFAANHSVSDPTGRFIARVDLALPSLKIAIEYEGDHHRDREQWRRDIARRRRLEAAGWFYIAVTQADLSSPHQLLSDLAAVIGSRRVAD